MNFLLNGNPRTARAPSENEVITIEDHVKNSEILKFSGNSRSFEYDLNDKAAKAKIVKAAKRSAFYVENHSSSSNLVFNPGAWQNVVLPSLWYWEEVKNEEKTCKIGDYNVKIGGIKIGVENNGKHVDSQVVFFADRDMTL